MAIITPLLQQVKSDFNVLDLSNFMFLGPVNRNKLIYRIFPLEKIKAPALDVISNKTIKCAHMHILEPLKSIVNMILITCEIQNNLKGPVSKK